MRRVHCFYCRNKLLLDGSYPDCFTIWGIFFRAFPVCHTMAWRLCCLKGGSKISSLKQIQSLVNLYWTQFSDHSGSSYACFLSDSGAIYCKMFQIILTERGSPNLSCKKWARNFIVDWISVTFYRIKWCI